MKAEQNSRKFLPSWLLECVQAGTFVGFNRAPSQNLLKWVFPISFAIHAVALVNAVVKLLLSASALTIVCCALVLMSLGYFKDNESLVLVSTTAVYPYIVVYCVDEPFLYVFRWCYAIAWRHLLLFITPHMTSFTYSCVILFLNETFMTRSAYHNLGKQWMDQTAGTMLLLAFAYSAFAWQHFRQKQMLYVAQLQLDRQKLVQEKLLSNCCDARIILDADGDTIRSSDGHFDRLVGCRAEGQQLGAFVQTTVEETGLLEACRSVAHDRKPAVLPVLFASRTKLDAGSKALNARMPIKADLFIVLHDSDNLDAGFSIGVRTRHESLDGREHVAERLSYEEASLDISASASAAASGSDQTNLAMQCRTGEKNKVPTLDLSEEDCHGDEERDVATPLVATVQGDQDEVPSFFLPDIADNHQDEEGDVAAYADTHGDQRADEATPGRNVEHEAVENDGPSVDLPDRDDNYGDEEQDVATPLVSVHRERKGDIMVAFDLFGDSMKIIKLEITGIFRKGLLPERESILRWFHNSDAFSKWVQAHTNAFIYDMPADAMPNFHAELGTTLLDALDYRYTALCSIEFAQSDDGRSRLGDRMQDVVANLKLWHFQKVSVQRRDR